MRQAPFTSDRRSKNRHATHACKGRAARGTRLLARKLRIRFKIGK